MKKIDKLNNKKRLITSALPYVNNEPHLGNMIQVLSADAFARFCRLKGYETYYVCGTDEYGTATETKAFEEKTSAYKLCSKYYNLHKEIYKWFNISFDNFSRTSNATHISITQNIFKKVYENGYITREKSMQFYCPDCKRFLADRFVEGQCPACKSVASGDQCETCGALLETNKLENPKCTLCSATPYLKETENLYIDLPKLKDKLEEFISNAEKEGRWANNAIQVARSWLNDGLRSRSITRDLNWGIKVPLKGFEDKVFYVWFDAPIGYISLTAMALKDSWQDWWMNNDNVNLYHFIGKDNIPFHTVIFPATLMATSQPWTMVHKLSSSEYLKFEGGKFSKSHNIGVFGSDCKSTNIPSDLWRFYLYYNRPEKCDSDFSFADFKDRINSEIVGNFSNLINRTFVFLEKEFNSIIPSFSYDKDFYEKVNKKIEEYDIDFENIELRSALRKILEISDITNKYFQDNEPWKIVKTDKQKCATVLSTLIRVIRDMAVLITPFMPQTGKKIISAIYHDNVIDINYDLLADNLEQGRRVDCIGHLFDKIDDDTICLLRDKFCKKEDKLDTNIDIDTKITGEFAKKVNLKVSKIVDVKRHPDADKLYILQVDTGLETRTIVSSIVPYYAPEELLNHNIVLVANLKPANFRGIKSYGMLLAASDSKDENHSTCEVIFADEFNVGEDLIPENESADASEWGVYVKPEKFFDMPLFTQLGYVKVAGAKIVSSSSKALKVYKYTNGNVG